MRLARGVRATTRPLAGPLPSSSSSSSSSLHAGRGRMGFSTGRGRGRGDPLAANKPAVGGITRERKSPARSPSSESKPAASAKFADAPVSPAGNSVPSIVRNRAPRADKDQGGAGRLVRKRAELLPDEDFPPPPPSARPPVRGRGKSDSAAPAAAPTATAPAAAPAGRGRGSGRGVASAGATIPVVVTHKGDPEFEDDPALANELLQEVLWEEAEPMGEPEVEPAARELLDEGLPLDEEPTRRPKMKERDLAKRQSRGKSEPRPLPLIVKDVELLDAKVVAQRLQTKARRAVPSAGRGKGKFDAAEWAKSLEAEAGAAPLRNFSLTEILRRTAAPGTEEGKAPEAGKKEVEELLGFVPRITRGQKAAAPKKRLFVARSPGAAGRGAGTERRMTQLTDTAQVDVQAFADDRERWKATVSYLVDKILGDEEAGVELMRRRRRKAAKLLKAFHAKKRAARPPPPRLAPVAASLLGSWEGLALYPALEAVPEGPVSEEVRAILGNSGWPLERRAKIAAKLVKTVTEFQLNGIHSKEEDLELESFLDEV